MDYQNELKKLEEMEAKLASEYFKPEAGQHKVTALGDLEDAEPFEKPGEEPQLRKQVRIKCQEKEFTWNMPFGKTKSSIYGQLINLAANHGNKLKDLTFTVVVVGTGQNKRFTIVI